MSSRFLNATGAVAIAAMLSLSSQASFAGVPVVLFPQGSPQVQAQSDDADPEMRIQRLENQLRQLTGQNEELQYRNRQLEERLRQLGGNAAAAPAAQPPVAQPSVAAAPPVQAYPPARQPQAQPGYPRPTRSAGAADLRAAADRSPRADHAGAGSAPQAPGRRRGDAFDPNQNPNAPGAPRALGGGQLPIANDAPVGAPGGRGPGEPLDLGMTSPRDPGGARPVRRPAPAPR